MNLSYQLILKYISVLWSPFRLSRYPLEFPNLSSATRDSNSYYYSHHCWQNQCDVKTVQKKTHEYVTRNIERRQILPIFPLSTDDQLHVIRLIWIIHKYWRVSISNKIIFITFSLAQLSLQIVLKTMKIWNILERNSEQNSSNHFCYCRYCCLCFCSFFIWSSSYILLTNTIFGDNLG